MHLLQHTHVVTELALEERRPAQIPASQQQQQKKDSAGLRNSARNRDSDAINALATDGTHPRMRAAHGKGGATAHAKATRHGGDLWLRLYKANFPKRSTSWFPSMSSGQHKDHHIKIHCAILFFNFNSICKDCKLPALRLSTKLLLATPRKP